MALCQGTATEQRSEACAPLTGSSWWDPPLPSHGGTPPWRHRASAYSEDSRGDVRGDGQGVPDDQIRVVQRTASWTWHRSPRLLAHRHLTVSFGAVNLECLWQKRGLSSVSLRVSEWLCPTFLCQVLSLAVHVSFLFHMGSESKPLSFGFHGFRVSVQATVQGVSPTPASHCPRLLLRLFPGLPPLCSSWDFSRLPTQPFRRRWRAVGSSREDAQARSCRTREDQDHGDRRHASALPGSGRETCGLLPIFLSEKLVTAPFWDARRDL